jgi:APA family basic amino acid/polyamine antiporter
VAVLSYYAITNAAALRLAPHERRWPRPIAIVGLVGCLVLIASLPPTTIATGVLTLAVGAAVRLLLARREPQTPGDPQGSAGRA